MGQFEDLTGLYFNNWFVKSRAPNGNCNQTRYYCVCRCGTEKIVTAQDLKTGHSKSCGCLKNDLIKKSKTIHGLSETRLHRIWRGILERCNPNSKSQNYNTYRRKCISVCDEWKNDFLSFYNWSISNGYDDSLTIDRIDNNGDYCPKNCRWVDMATQSRNKDDNRYFEFGGQIKVLSDWANEYGINMHTLKDRIDVQHMSFYDALTTPIKKERIFVCNGKSLTLKQWAEETGFSINLLRKRIYEMHWPLEKVFYTPKQIHVQKREAEEAAAFGY